MPDASDVRAALVAAVSVIQQLGGAQVGDRTLVDALVPFVTAFPAEAASVADAWEDALPPMRAAVAGTAGLAPRRGRSATHGANALGTVDPGARSLELSLEAVGRSLRASDGDHEDPAQR
jgi:dihydroxyacetone kinase